MNLQGQRLEPYFLQQNGDFLGVHNCIIQSARVGNNKTLANVDNNCRRHFTFLVPTIYLEMRTVAKSAVLSNPCSMEGYWGYVLGAGAQMGE